MINSSLLTKVIIYPPFHHKQQEGIFCVTGKDAHERSNLGALLLGFYPSGCVCSYRCLLYGILSHYLECTHAQVDIPFHSIFNIFHKDPESLKSFLFFNKFVLNTPNWYHRSSKGLHVVSSYEAYLTSYESLWSQPGLKVTFTVSGCLSELLLD